MSIRTWLNLPTLGLVAVACGTESATTASDTSTGEPQESSSSDDPTTQTTTVADTSSSSTDPTTLTTTPVDTSSSSGPVELCGNGDLDDGEECDDENTADGDDCTAMCTVPYEVVWTQTHNGSASNQDSFNEAAVDGAGNIYVVGRERVTGEAFNLFLRQYMADGTEGWTVSYNGLFNADDSGSALVLLPDGDIVVAGTSEGEFDGDDIFAARIDGTTQEIEWEILQDGPGMGPGADDDADSASDVTIDADGNVYVVGSIRVGALNWDLWIGKYDGDGLELWQQSYDGAAGGRDFARAVAVDADGVAWLLGNEEDGDESAGVVLGFDADGMPLAGETQALGFFANDMAIDADGNIHIAGSTADGGTFDDIAVRKYDPTWTELWAVDVDIDGSNDFPVGLSVGPTGNVYIGGTTRATAAEFDAFLRVYDLDGTPLWGAEYRNEEGMLDDQFNFVVEHPDGDVIAAGYESVLGEQTNGIVIKYHAL